MKLQIGKTLYWAIEESSTNHYCRIIIVALNSVLSRYKEQPSDDTGDVPGGVVNKNGQPVVEVLLLKMEGGQQFVFPQVS